MNEEESEHQIEATYSYESIDSQISSTFKKWFNKLRVYDDPSETLNNYEQWIDAAIQVKRVELKREGKWLPPHNLGEVKEESSPDTGDTEGVESKEKDKDEGAAEQSVSNPISEEVTKGKNESQGGEESDDEVFDEELQSPESQRAIRYLLRKALPRATKTLLRTRYPSPTKERVNRFLQKVLNLVALYIATQSKRTLVKLLNWLLDPDIAFYPVHQSYTRTLSGQVICHSEAPPEIPGNYATQYGRISVYLVDNINSFGCARGFDYIAASIGDKEDPISLSYMILLLRPIQQIRKCLKASFCSSWMKKVSKAVFKRLSSMEDEELKAISNDDVDGIISIMEKLCKLEGDGYGKRLEKFKLSLAYKCLQSTNLPKRLYGLNSINKLIEMADRKEVKDKHKDMGIDNSYLNPMTRFVKSPPTTKWLTLQYMIQWLQHINIVEELFGKKIHSELVGRSQDILRLLTENHQFKEEYLDLLWNAVAGKGKQERIIDIVFSMVEVLTPFFSPEHVDYLLTKIRESKAYDSKSLALMKLLTLQQLSDDNDEERKKQGLLLFWNAIQDENFVSAQTTKEAMNHLREIIRRSRCASYRESFIELCVDNLIKNYSVPQSLKLLLGILEKAQPLYFMDQYVVDTSSLVHQLEERFQLLPAFFANIDFYKANATERLQRILKEKAEESEKLAESGRQSEAKLDVNDAILIGVQSHLKQVNIRLRFMRFIFKHSSLYITTDQVDTLWKCFIANAFTQEERDLMFNWFSKICASRYMINPKDVVEMTAYIFEKKLCQLDFKNLTSAGFNCFEEYFRKYNMLKGTIEDLEYKLNEFIIHDFNLFGLDALWHLALTVETDLVANMSIAYLTSLYDPNKLSHQVKGQLGTIRSSYVNTIMSHLEQACKEQPASVKRIIRAIVILKSFIEDYESKKEEEEEYNSFQITSSGGFPMTLQFHTHRSDLRFSLNVSSTLMLGELREKVAQRLQRPIDAFQLHVADFEDADSFTLEELNITHLKPIYFSLNDPDDKVDLKMSGETPSLRESGGYSRSFDNNGRAIAPTYLLANNQAHFDLLFSMLTFDNEVAQLAWDLISFIPTNAAMEQKIQHFHLGSEELRPKWSELVDPRSTFSLLYSLRIIKTTLAADDFTLGGHSDQEEWYAQFIKTGGLKHLCDILTNQHTLHGSMAKKCILALLEIINTFLQSTILSSMRLPEGGSIDYGELCKCFM